MSNQTTATSDGINLTRRRTLSGMLYAAAWFGSRRIVAGQSPGSDHGNRVNPPRAVPDIPVICDDGRTVGLASLLKEHATALQLVFTECTTTCPIQGAIFERVQNLLPEQSKYAVQLISLSVDPVRDTPEALHKWLERFHARPGWIAAAPQVADLAAIRGFFGDDGPVANHGTRVQIINRRGELIWRTLDLPSAESVAAILRKME
jgi:protein SCO1